MATAERVKAKKTAKAAKKGDNRRKILKSAEKQFARDGYHGASIRDIALDCGLHLPSIYYHFGNKEQLFRSVLFDTHNQAVAEVQASVNREGGLREEVVSIFEALLDHHRRNPRRTRIIFRMVYSAPDGLCDEYAETKGKQFRELIQAAFARNRPRHNPKLKLLCMIDTLESFLLSMSFPNQKTDRMPVYHRTIDYILSSRRP